MQLGLLESLWPSPTANVNGRAQEFHIGRFARWLQVAGAEPRLALILCAGPQAKVRLIDLLEAEDVDVRVCPATDARPLPREVLEHQGDHFNRRLFLVDGFESCDRREVLSTLNGQRSQLRRMATWVGLIIESPEALATLYEFAGALVADVMRRCLIVDLDDTSPVHTSAPAAQLNLWRSRGAIAEIAFHTAITRGETADYHDVSRLFRTGYGLGLPAPHSPLLTTALELVSGQSSAPPAETALDVLSAYARHGRTSSDAHERLSMALADRPFCRLAAGIKPRAPWEVTVAHAAQAPARVALEPAVVARMIQEAQPNVPWSAVVGQLAAAQIAASRGDVEGCGSALDALVEEASSPRIAPEVYFNALEYRVRFEVGLSRRADARAILDLLEVLEPRIQSPLYAARTCLARGDFMVALDPVMANEEYREAERLFSAHGYPDWAEQAVRRQERIR